MAVKQSIFIVFFFFVFVVQCPLFGSEKKEQDPSSSSHLMEHWEPLRDPLLVNILPSSFTPQELRCTIALINHSFYKLVSGYNLPNDLSKKPEESALKGISFLSNIDVTLKIVEGYTSAVYKEGAIPGFIWGHLTALGNLHSTWWPYIKGTQAEIVKLNSTCLEPEEVANFAISLHGTSVHTVYFTSNYLGLQGGKALGENLKAPVHTVFLTSNYLGWDGAIAFCQELDLSVQTLHIVKNFMGDQGAVKIGQALKDKSIQILSLADNGITDEGVLGFALNMEDRKDLTVYLESNPITEATKTFLLQQYPNIEWIF